MKFEPITKFEKFAVHSYSTQTARIFSSCRNISNLTQIDSRLTWSLDLEDTTLTTSSGKLRHIHMPDCHESDDKVLQYRYPPQTPNIAVVSCFSRGGKTFSSRPIEF